MRKGAMPRHIFTFEAAKGEPQAILALLRRCPPELATYRSCVDTLEEWLGTHDRTQDVSFTMSDESSEALWRILGNARAQTDTEQRAVGDVRRILEAYADKDVRFGTGTMSILVPPEPMAESEPA